MGDVYYRVINAAILAALRDLAARDVLASLDALCWFLEGGESEAWGDLVNLDLNPDKILVMIAGGKLSYERIIQQRNFAGKFTGKNRNPGLTRDEGFSERVNPTDTRGYQPGSRDC